MKISYFAVLNSVVNGIGVLFKVAADCLCKPLPGKLVNNIGGYALNSVVFFLRLLGRIAGCKKHFHYLRFKRKLGKRAKSAEAPLIIRFIFIIK